MYTEYLHYRKLSYINTHGSAKKYIEYSPTDGGNPNVPGSWEPEDIQQLNFSQILCLFVFLKSTNTLLAVAETPYFILHLFCFTYSNQDMKLILKHVYSLWAKEK